MRLTLTCRLSNRAVTASIAVLSGWLVLATPSLAQQRVSNPADGRTPGMRYLTWPGKNESPRPSRTAPTPSAPRIQAEPAPEIRDDAEPRGPILSMPSQPLVAPVATRYSARTSPGPTPASAWISNGGAPTSAPRIYAEPTDAPGLRAARLRPHPDFRLRPGSAAGDRCPGAQRRSVLRGPLATLPEPPRGYPPVVPLDAPAPRTERVVEAPVYDAPTYERLRSSPRPMRPPASSGPSPPTLAPPPNRRRPPSSQRSNALPRRPPAPADAPPVETPPSIAPMTPAVDPYAPRPDAPIFRLLNRNSQPAPVPEQPAPQPSGPDTRCTDHAHGSVRTRSDDPGRTCALPRRPDRRRSLAPSLLGPPGQWPVAGPCAPARPGHARFRPRGSGRAPRDPDRRAQRQRSPDCDHAGVRRPCPTMSAPLTDTAAASRLPDLIALAQEPSSEKRRALLRELTEHFFGSPVRSDGRGRPLRHRPVRAVGGHGDRRPGRAVGPVRRRPTRPAA